MGTVKLLTLIKYITQLLTGNKLIGKSKCMPSENKLEKMLFETNLHLALSLELSNMDDLDKRKDMIHSLYHLLSHTHPYQNRKIIAKRRVIRMLQEIYILTIQEQVLAIHPMDEEEKNHVYIRIIKPARESGLLNHHIPRERRLALRARISAIVHKLNQDTPKEPLPSSHRESAPDSQLEQMLH